MPSNNSLDERSEDSIRGQVSDLYESMSNCDLGSDKMYNILQNLLDNKKLEEADEAVKYRYSIVARNLHDTENSFLLKELAEFRVYNKELLLATEQLELIDGKPLITAIQEITKEAILEYQKIFTEEKDSEQYQGKNRVQAPSSEGSLAQTTQGLTLIGSDDEAVLALASAVRECKTLKKETEELKNENQELKQKYTSLLHLENVLEPEMVKIAVIGYTKDLKLLGESKVPQVLYLLENDNSDKIESFKSALETKKTGLDVDEQKKMEQVIKAIQGLTDLVYGQSEIVERIKRIRSDNKHDQESRSDGVNIEKYVKSTALSTIKEYKLALDKGSHEKSTARASEESSDKSWTSRVSPSKAADAPEKVEVITKSIIELAESSGLNSLSKNDRQILVTEMAKQCGLSVSFEPRSPSSPIK